MCLYYILELSAFDSILLICVFKTIFIYCDRERSSFSAKILIFSNISLSIVMLILFFNGFKTITSKIIIH